METSDPSTSGINNHNEEYEEFDEISDFDDAEANKHSLIQEIQYEIAADDDDSKANNEKIIESKTNGAIMKKSDSFSSEKIKELDTDTSSKENLQIASTSTSISDDTIMHDDYLHNKEWLMQKKHIFVLSSAGKPIYSLHGNEDKLATLFGVLLALVSFVQSNEDSITSIHAYGIKFVFLVRNALILVAISRQNLSVHQLQMQLT